MRVPATALLKRIVPAGLYRPLRACWTRWRRPIDWHALRRLEPVGCNFGFDRGQCLDRYYIEAFLARHAGDIRGRVLEVGEPLYTKKYGAARVTQSDVLHAVPGNAGATFVGDLAAPATLPDATFDCIILTQTLQYVYDVRAALHNCQRALRPGGVLLASVPALSQTSRPPDAPWQEYWRFTSDALARLCGEIFPGGAVEVHAHGNVLVATAFLHGLATEELTPAELDYQDANYEVVLTVRAGK